MKQSYHIVLLAIVKSCTCSPATFRLDCTCTLRRSSILARLHDTVVHDLLPVSIGEQVILESDLRSTQSLSHPAEWRVQLFYALPMA